MIDIFKSQAIWTSKPANQGGVLKKGQLIAISLLDKNDLPTMKVPMGEKLLLKVLYQKNSAIPLHIHVVFKNRFNQIVFSGGTYTLGIDVSSVQQGDLALLDLIIDCMLEAGEYTFLVKISEASAVPNRGIEIDASPWLGPLTVVFDYVKVRAPFFGMFGIPCKGKISPVGKTTKEYS